MMVVVRNLQILKARRISSKMDTTNMLRVSRRFIMFKAKSLIKNVATMKS